MSTSFKFWAGALRKFSPAKPKVRAQYGKLVLVVVLVMQSEGLYFLVNVTLLIGILRSDQII